MKIAEYIDDPKIIEALFGDEDNYTNDPYKLLKVPAIDTLIDEIITSYFDKPIVDSQIIKTYEDLYSGELVAIALSIIKSGGRDKFIRENVAPLSQQNLDTIVKEINRNFYTCKTNSNIAATALTANATGPLLYPCSGADVTYPILLCPNVHEFYLVDEHPLFDPLLSKFKAGLKEVIGDSELKESLKFLSPINEAVGAWPGYDCTVQTSYVDSNHLGLMMLLRLKQLCGMDLSSLEMIEDGVYKIQGYINNTPKTIYYVAHAFGEESLAFNWLKNQAQTRNIDTFFLKAFSASIMSTTISLSFFYQFKSLIPTEQKKLTIISDTSNDYHNGLVPSLIDPTQVEKCIHEVPFCFGYNENKMMVANSNVFLQEYLSIIVQRGRKNRASAIIQRERQLFFQSIENKITSFKSLSYQSKLASLLQDGYIKINEDDITLALDSSPFVIKGVGHKLEKWFSKWIDEQKPTSLTIELRDSLDCKHIDSLLMEIIELLPQLPISSLKISVPSGNEVSFVSRKAIEVAKGLVIYGRNLETLEVQVNDKAALEFITTFSKLKEFSLRSASIAPINSWRPETTETVRKYMLSLDDTASSNLQITNSF